MKAIMVMYDSLNRHMLPNYGNSWVLAPNFERLGKIAATFDTCYVGSMPCMPARRELHTGRYNFLHRSWGPMEPFDDSMPQLLVENGIYTHLSSDHAHYWEDGGATYHSRYTTWEGNRGQEGDPWKPLVNVPPMPEHLGQLWERDWANRQFINTTEKMPQTRTFNGGVEFIDNNHDADNWFLQVETFDPHEPFYAMPEFRELYEKNYDGPFFDWPTYGDVTDAERPYLDHLRRTYAALLTMCDRSLGRILDKMDEYNMWDDTLLIVNTDHGFFLGEHDHWAKGPTLLMREEVAHTPLFIYDPRTKATGRRKSLVQTIDLAPTILDYFGVEIPKDMEGKSLLKTVEDDTPVRDAAILGMFGGHITCTDGRYKYTLAPNEENWPLYQYTLMPTHMRSLFAPGELFDMTLAKPFDFTKNVPVLKIPDRTYLGMIPMSNRIHIPGYDEVKPHQYKPAAWKTELFDLESDPHEDHPIENAEVTDRLRHQMTDLMIKNDAPKEQYIRMGLEKEYQDITGEEPVFED